MRVFVVGASGVIGSRLVPQLIECGHEVIGTAPSPGKAERLRRIGAESVVLDALDPRAVREAVAAAGEVPVVMATESRGASNAKAKRELGWALRYPSWRQGFAAMYPKPAAVIAAPRPVPATERVGSSAR